MSYRQTIQWVSMKFGMKVLRSDLYA